MLFYFSILETFLVLFRGNTAENIPHLQLGRTLETPETNVQEQNDAKVSYSEAATAPPNERRDWRTWIQFIKHPAYLFVSVLPGGPGGPRGPWVPIPGLPLSPFSPDRPGNAHSSKPLNSKSHLTFALCGAHTARSGLINGATLTNPVVEMALFTLLHLFDSCSYRL